LHLVDFGNNVGLGSSIAIGRDGLPIVTYDDQTAQQLKVAKCSDAACAASTRSVVDSVNYGQSQVVIGADGLPLISYVGSDHVLKVARCGDAACSAPPTITTLASDALAGSLAIGTDGLPVVAYTTSALNLVVMKCNDPACAGHNERSTTVVSGGVAPAIAIGLDGLPVLAYSEAPSFIDVLAHCSDPACANSSVRFQELDSVSASSTNEKSVAIGADGVPIVAFRGDDPTGTVQAMKVVRPARP